jgi:RNA polymerase sigma-70 factor, ECF subfamily
VTKHGDRAFDAGDLHPAPAQAVPPLPQAPGGPAPAGHATTLSQQPGHHAPAPAAAARAAPGTRAAGGDPAPGAGIPDADLLRRHVAGDPDAFGILFLRHRDRLWAVALRTLSDPEEAADALQEAMISAFRRAGSFRGDSAVTTWLHRIVVNACLDRLRRRAARPVSAGLDEQALDLLTREPQVPDHGGDTDTALEVTAALRTLPPEQRAALVLVDMLGYPVADAAEVLGVSVGTIKSRCARGRARLLPRLAHLRGGPQSGATGPPDGHAAGKGNPAPPGCVSPAEGGGDSRP